ncbi:DUF393 domain-containing protein [Candidatus Kaiserbacteria bacterium]|nr:DUF393 domain-containing protein [Candidatus Kaiserbacteria bacterium]
MENKLTVVFDDGCPLCTVAKNVTDSLDKKDAMEFVGMNTERGQALIEEHKFDMNKSAYVVRTDGTTAEKAEMAREIFAHNGFLGFLFSLPFRIPYVGNLLYSAGPWTRWYTTKSKK